MSEPLEISTGSEKVERLNFLLTDGRSMVATRWHNDLYWVERLGVHDCEICGIPHVHHDQGGEYRAIVIASEPIAYPRVLEADVLVALSQPGFDKFAGAVATGGVVVVERDLVEGDGAVPVPFVRTAEEVGHKIVANIVMLG